MIIHQPWTGAATLWQIWSEKERLAFHCPTPQPLPRFAGSLSNVIESADSKLLTCTFEGKKRTFKMSPIWPRQVSVSGRHLHECWCRCHGEKFLWLLGRGNVQNNLMFLWLCSFKMNKIIIIIQKILYSSVYRTFPPLLGRVVISKNIVIDTYHTLHFCDNIPKLWGISCGV